MGCIGAGTTVLELKERELLKVKKKSRGLKKLSEAVGFKQDTVKKWFTYIKRRIPYEAAFVMMRKYGANVALLCPEKERAIANKLLRKPIRKSKYD